MQRLFLKKSMMMPFLSLPYWKKILIFLMLPLFINFIPLKTFFTLQHQEQALIIEQMKVKKSIRNKQRQLTPLKRKRQAQILTPTLARQLLPIDQHITTKQHKHFQITHLQWRTTPKIFLDLEIRSTFYYFQLFLQDLIQTFPLIQLVELHIEKEESPLLHIKTHWEYHFSNLTGESQ